MPHFTLQIGSRGPIVMALVFVSEARQTALVAAGRAIPAPVSMQALIDTGASCTCVDFQVLAPLALSPTGSTPISTPSTGTSPHHMDQYDVGIAIPGADPGSSPLILPTVPIVACSLRPQGIDALIGRDVLGRCLLSYNGATGAFTLAF